MVNRKLLIDGDILAYRIGFACQPTTYRGVVEDIGIVETPTKGDLIAAEATNIEAVPQPESEASVIDTTRKYVGSFIDTYAPDGDFRLFLSGPCNFRKDIATVSEYKGGRKDKPVHLELVRQTIADTFDFVTFSQGQEADDDMGIAQSQAGDGETAIISADKDMRQIRGLHIVIPGPTAKDQSYRRIKVSQRKADYTFWCQMLTGDRCDNIMGVPGLGDIKAAKLLEPVMGNNRASLRVIEDAYRTAHSNGKFPPVTQDTKRWDDIVLEMGRLLWIRREPDQMWDAGTLK